MTLWRIEMTEPEAIKYLADALAVSIIVFSVAYYFRGEK